MGTAETCQQPQTEGECKLLITGSFASVSIYNMVSVMNLCKEQF